MRVLVTGGTGFVGTALCEELAGRGHEVTALARDPAEADFDADVTTVRGDVTEYESIEDHFAGVDAAVNLVALSPLFKPRGGDEMHFEVHLDGTENAVTAAEEHGVGKFVQMSALGADPDGPTAYIRAKGQAEEAVKNSSLEWTVFQPSVIFGEGGEFVEFTKKLAPPYLTPLPGGGDTKFQPIWLGDVVPMLADAVEGTSTGPRTRSDDVVEGTVTGPQADEGEHGGGNGEADLEPAVRPVDEGDGDPHAGRTYEVGGPEVLSLAAVARLAHAADRKPVNVVPIPMPLAGVGLSVLDAIPGAPMGKDQYRSLRMDNVTTRNAVDTFGYAEADLTTLQEYLGVTDELLAELER